MPAYTRQTFSNGNERIKLRTSGYEEAKSPLKNERNRDSDDKPVCSSRLVRKALHGAVWVRALARVNMLCSWTRYFTLLNQI